MGFLHYFSADEDKRAKFIFNLIAPVYGLIDHAISDNYREIADKLNEIFPLKGKKVLDVGTGTDGKDLRDFPDGSYNIVTCSFMMHGMRKNLREKVLKEMIRVAGKAVVVHDFYGDITWPTKLLESLERSAIIRTSSVLLDRNLRFFPSCQDCIRKQWEWPLYRMEIGKGECSFTFSLFQSDGFSLPVYSVPARPHYHKDPGGIQAD